MDFEDKFNDTFCLISKQKHVLTPSFFLCLFENRVLLKPVSGGVGSVAHMNRLNKPSLLFSFL